MITKIKMEILLKSERRWEGRKEGGGREERKRRFSLLIWQGDKKYRT